MEAVRDLAAFAIASMLALAAAQVSFAQAPISHPGDYTFTVQHDGLARMYRVHVPAKYDPARASPLLVALHGGGANMNLQADDALYGQISKSESEGFIAVFPNGYSRFASGMLATWNAGNCCGAARDRQIDDVGFIRQVVDNLARQVNIDRARIYATGMSNGAMMAYRLACDAPDMFSAIAPVAGTDTTRQCAPDRPVGVVHIHARDDSHVLFRGGAGPDSVSRSQITDYVPVPATIAKWAKLDGCAPVPRPVLDRPGARCEAYAACNGGVQVQLCVTETGGHSWPGGARPRARGAAPSDAISANDVMWEFFDRR